MPKCQDCIEWQTMCDLFFFFPRDWPISFKAPKMENKFRLKVENTCWWQKKKTQIVSILFNFY